MRILASGASSAHGYFLSLCLYRPLLIRHRASVVDGGGTVFYLPHVKGKIRSLAPDGTTDQFVPRRADGRQADDPHKLAMDNAGNLYLMGWGDMWRVSQKGKVSIILPSRSVKALSINGGPNGDKTEETAIFWNTPLAVELEGQRVLHQFPLQAKCLSNPESRSQRQSPNYCWWKEGPPGRKRSPPLGFTG